LTYAFVAFLVMASAAELLVREKRHRPSPGERPGGGRTAPRLSGGDRGSHPGVTAAPQPRLMVHRQRGEQPDCVRRGPGCA
jgi:hypothetical protein